MHSETKVNWINEWKEPSFHILHFNDNFVMNSNLQFALNISMSYLLLPLYQIG